MQSEIEKSGGITTNKLLDILTKQEFSAKEDFLKGFGVALILGSFILEVVKNKNKSAG